jgi:hypothetical protein
MRTEPLDPYGPGNSDYGRNDHPDSGGEHYPPGLEPREPSWGDVIGGIWRRLTDPTLGT